MNRSFTINIGFGNYVVADQIKAVIQPNSAPVKRLIKNKLSQNKVIDSTMGKKLRAVIVLKEDTLILSAITVASLISRFENE